MKWALIFLLSIKIIHAIGEPKSDHFDGKHFFNPGHEDRNSFLDLLKWKFTSNAKAWPESVQNKDYPAPVLAEGKKASFTFINHATFLVQTPQVNFLTDPVFSERVSPVKFAGPKRVRPPGVSLDKLPSIDVVVISHNHYDHMDLDSLKELDKKFHPLFIVPLGNREFLLMEGLQNVVELDWWQEQKVKDAIITFTPSLHWSSRTLWDKYETLWGSYMVTTPGFKFYFAGDTGYAEHFRDTKMRLGAPDVALLPIGAYEPRWFMKMHHMNPAEAIEAHKDLEAGITFGMHFGTFQLTDEGIDGPVNDLKKSLGEIKNFEVLDQGEARSF
jgi:L-ascorbate metabolism protein UlaG (beta-lactamase superfamily)